MRLSRVNNLYKAYLHALDMVCAGGIDRLAVSRRTRKANHGSTGHQKAGWSF